MPVKEEVAINERCLSEQPATTVPAIAPTREAKVCQRAKQYFDTFNQQQFEKTAALFSPQGMMYPPFDSAVTGPEEILAYLQRAATSMQALPTEWTCKPTETGSWQVTVKGKVKTSLFKVNVGWQFEITLDGQIAEVRIKLLASPAELLNLRSISKA